MHFFFFLVAFKWGMKTLYFIRLNGTKMWVLIIAVAHTNIYNCNIQLLVKWMQMFITLVLVFFFHAFIIVTMIHSYMILRFLLLNVNFIMNWLDVKETHTEKNNTRVREMKEKSQSLAKLMRKDVKF